MAGVLGCAPGSQFLQKSAERPGQHLDFEIPDP